MQPELNQELSLLRKQVWGGGNSKRSSRVALLLHMAADRHAHVALSLARARLAECMFLRDSMTVDRQLLVPIDACTDSPPTQERADVSARFPVSRERRAPRREGGECQGECQRRTRDTSAAACVSVCLPWQGGAGRRTLRRRQRRTRTLTRMQLRGTT